jgi:ankyrin repeat protein
LKQSLSKQLETSTEQVRQETKELWDRTTQKREEQMQTKVEAETPTQLEKVQEATKLRLEEATIELWKATTDDDPQGAEFAVRKGANVNGTDSDEMTPLHHWAERPGHLKLLTALLNSNANVDQQDNLGRTALHLADREGYETGVKELLKRYKHSEMELGRKPVRRKAQGDFQEVLLPLQICATVDERTVFGRTPLHLAAREGRDGVMKLLIQHGADVDAKDTDGWT